MYGTQKAKGLFSILKYKKFQALISKWDVLFKNDQILWFVKKPNEKLLRFVIIFLWEVIYVHFYNWDRPLDLVSVVYDLIDWSLKLHSSLRTIPHLILTHNTQVLVQLMFISFVWLFMLKCDVYAQLHVDQTQKYFWVFYIFLKCFYAFML